MTDSTDIRYADANGIRFGYLQAGPADGPLALCLHGFPDSAHTWRHLLPSLAELGYHAVAPFSRGYAPTQVPADGGYQLGALVADAVALHEVLGGDEKAVLIGHDWGAEAVYGAISFAPDRWRRAVTMAVAPEGSIAPTFLGYGQLRRSFYIFLFQTPLAEAAVSADDFAFVDGLWRDWSPGYPGAADAARAKDCLRSPASLTAAIGYYRAMFDPTRHLPRYAAEQAAATAGGGCPVLFLHGALDGCLGVETATHATEYLPAGSRLEVIDGVGHFLHLERPELIAARVADWIR